MITDAIKRLGKHTLLYGVGSAISSAVGFILIPLYTHHLTTADYGILEVVNTWLSILAVLLVFGLGPALLKSYLDNPNPALQKKSINVAFTMSLFFSILGMAIFSVVVMLLSNSFHAIKELLPFLFIMSVLVFISNIMAIFFSILRAREQSKEFLAISVLSFFAQIIMAIILVAWLNRKIYGVLETKLFTHATVIIFMFFILKEHFIGLQFDKSIAKKLVFFGFPLIPVGFFTWVIDLSDRLFVQHYCSLSELGIYALGYKYGSLLSIPIMAFQTAWSPFLMTIVKEKQVKEICAKVFTYFVSFLVFLALALSLFAKEIIGLMSPQEYWGASQISWIVATGYVFWGVYLFASAESYIRGSTLYLAVLIGIGALLNLILNFLLIPSYKIFGAAISTCLTYIILAVISWVFVYKKFPIYFEWKRLAKLAISIIAVVLILNYCPNSILLKFFLIIAFLLSLFVLRFFEKRELELIQEKIKTIFK